MKKIPASPPLPLFFYLHKFSWMGKEVSQSVTESDSVSLEKGRALILMHFPVTKQSFNHYSLFALFYLCSLFPLDTSPLSLVYQFYDCFFAPFTDKGNKEHRVYFNDVKSN